MDSKDSHRSVCASQSSSVDLALLTICCTSLKATSCRGRAQCRKTLQTQLAALRESEELWKHAWRPPDKCAIISILFKSMEVEHPYLSAKIPSPLLLLFPSFLLHLLLLLLLLCLWCLMLLMYDVDLLQIAYQSGISSISHAGHAASHPCLLVAWTPHTLAYNSKT